MRKAQWAKSTNGPDWMDLEAAMRALGELTDGTVMVSFSPRGIGSTGGLQCAVTWHPKVDRVDGNLEMIVTESYWPCAEGCTLEGHILAGIYILDSDLAERMRQREIPM